MPDTLQHGSRRLPAPQLAEDSAPVANSSGASRIGTRIGKYEIVRVVGKGGMGCVYEAINTTIKKRVAIKCIDHQLLKNDEAYERFHREALAASSVESPNIVQIFDAGKTDDGIPYIVMELLRGADLGHTIAGLGRLPVEDALVVVLQMLKGLHHAHAAGIVHRDLKPDNVFLVEREDEPHVVKLLDFGVSKMARNHDVPLETLTRQGTVVGTPYYMSPEQAQAFPDVDGRTDIYSAGAILYECLTGRPPHVGKSYEQVIVNICMHDADDVRSHNTDVSAAVAQVIRRALSREREDRFKSAREMLDALLEAAPESFRVNTPSSRLRTSLGSSAPRTPMVISPTPASAPPSVLADTVNATAPDLSPPEQTTLTRSGVTPKSQREPTLPSSTRGKSPRRWMVAIAPGVALLVAVVLWLRISTRGNDNENAAVASKDDGAQYGRGAKDAAREPTPPAAIAPPPSASAPPKVAATAAASASASVAKSKHPRLEPSTKTSAIPNARPSAHPPIAEPEPGLRLQNP